MPPSLRLPAIVDDLRGERVGDHAVLHWTMPAQTTDGVALKQPPVANVCLTPEPAAAGAMPFCLRDGTGSSLRVVDRSIPLPADLTAGPAHLLACRIELLNAAGRSAGFSAPVYLAGGDAPAPLAGLRVQATRGGAQIEWNPAADAASAPVELHRRTVATPEVRATAIPSRKPAPTEIVLRVNDGTLRQDPGGTIDPGARAGTTYRYTAQRVRELTLAGHKVRLAGEPSAPVELAFRDAFPPRPPKGLAAITDAEVAGLTGALAVSLSWEPSMERDLAGYNVYRADVDRASAERGASAKSANFRKLNATPLAGPSFRDTAATHGHTYLYRVTAVDEAGNESAASPALQQILP